MDINNKKRERLFLIDGSSYIYRAFYALPYLSNTKGLPTNAVYGFTTMLLKVIKEYKPDHIAVVFDAKGPTFRKELFIEYKAQRPEMPDTLKPQIPYIKEIVSAFQIPVLEKEGYEADDIIGTVSKAMEVKGIDVVIVTGDKDMLQLVNNYITILDTMKERVYGVRDVMERFGVEPERIVEIMGLAGDSIDNIPGVPGIGEKTAVRLIRKFGSIEKLLKNLEKLPNKRLRENLENYKEQAILSRSLASIDTGVPISYTFEEFKLTEPDYGRLKALLKELEFNKLLKEIIPPPSADLAPKEGFKTILNMEELYYAVEEVKRKGEASIQIYNPINDPVRGRIEGIALSCEEDKAYYIPTGGGDLRLEEVLRGIKEVMEDKGIKKYGYDLKASYILLKRRGIHLSGMELDTMLASYLLNPLKAPYSMEALSEEYLDKGLYLPNEIRGFEDIKKYMCELALTNYILSQTMLDRLKEKGLLSLFTSIEMPLIEVLAEMELVGIKVDEGLLQTLSSELQGEMGRMEERIYHLAGGEFNINSPKQLQKVLFEILRLKPVKKTKTGYSTDEEVLKLLSLQYELPMDILNYRHISKLKSTYVDALINLINPETGRVHTSFNQATTATGRLSSSEPNLQNIPIRSEIGRRIRGVFVAEEGNLLLSADYSQIELRIVAHLSQDPLLIEAFKGDEDIHRRTASNVFHCLPGLVTEDMRRQAKAITFGIIYGISPYGLSQNLGVSQKEAKEYIENYFAIHKGVKGYIDRTLSEAKERGYVTTIFGRQRPVPELKSKNPSIRGLGERIAINTPIQGTAADIIKKAMIDIHRRFREKGFKARMLLQIHDELLFEVPEEEINEVRRVVKEGMEGIVELSVPLKVDIGVGRNWMEAHFI